MLNHHSLGIASGAGGVNHIGQLIGSYGDVEVIGEMGRDLGGVCVQAHDLSLGVG